MRASLHEPHDFTYCAAGTRRAGTVPRHRWDLMADADPTADSLDELADFAPALADVLGMLSNDVALVLDARGVIRKVVLGGSESGTLRAASARWLGQTLGETVTGDTRRKADALLQDLAASGVSQPRQVNHPCPDGAEIPVSYTAVRLGGAGPRLVVGRDLRVVRAFQQRFIRAQQEMERSYWKLRLAASRQRNEAGDAGATDLEAALRALFERTQDPVAITDTGGRVLFGNPALAELLGLEGAAVVQGEPLGRWLGADGGVVPAAAAALVRDGTLPAFDAPLRSGRGRSLRLEVTATLLPTSPEPCIGFILRTQAASAFPLPRNRTDDDPANPLH